MSEPLSYSVVIPTIGRARLSATIEAILTGPPPAPQAVVVVDDRRDPSGSLGIDSVGDRRVRVVETGGHGPAAARNAGWQTVTSDWVAFVDDDVRLPDDWTRRLAQDLGGLPEDVAGSQGRVHVPRSSACNPTDDERRTLALSTSQWITADMAYRRRALMQVGGFDPAFPRAYREDSDLALRLVRSGWHICRGARQVEHPVAPGGWMRSVSVQAGNADDARMRRKHGRGWRADTGAGRGRLRLHAMTVALALTAVAATLGGRRRQAMTLLVAWSAMWGDFALRRVLSGPQTGREIATMLLTSAAIPFAAVYYRIRGEWRVWRTRRVQPVSSAPAAVLFDRDDTLIVDVPYLADPDAVEPVDDAVAALCRLRRRGVATGIISNQSGVARGLISREQLRQVNSRVDRLLGPFDTWQVCPHSDTDGCACRKPGAGMVLAAAAELGVSPRRCVVVGDIGSDVEAALAAGARAIMVPTRRTQGSEVRAARHDACVVSSLTDAVDAMVGDQR